MAVRDAPAVTVIVIAHDVRDEVLACLDSIHRHADGLAVQTVLVDNGSRDGTAEAVRATFPGVEIEALAKNEGIPARNYGLRRARGRYRMFLDSDAVLTAGALRTLVDTLDADASIGVVGPRLLNLDGTTQLSARRYPPALLPFLRRPPLSRFFEDGPTVRRHLMDGEDLSRRRRVEYLLGACMLFRREAQEAVGQIDTRIWYGHDDADWCFRIRQAGYDVVYEPAAEVVHGYRRTSSSNPVSKLALRFLIAHVYFQWKWRRSRRALIEEGRAMDREARP
jgi:GT2 family glycosyltransferase